MVVLGPDDLEQIEEPVDDPRHLIRVLGEGLGQGPELGGLVGAVDYDGASVSQGVQEAVQEREPGIRVLVVQELHVGQRAVYMQDVARPLGGQRLVAACPFVAGDGGHEGLEVQEVEGILNVGQGEMKPGTDVLFALNNAAQDSLVDGALDERDGHVAEVIDPQGLQFLEQRTCPGKLGHSVAAGLGDAETLEGAVPRRGAVGSVLDVGALGQSQDIEKPGHVIRQLSENFFHHGVQAGEGEEGFEVEALRSSDVVPVQVEDASFRDVQPTALKHPDLDGKVEEVLVLDALGLLDLQ